MLKAKIISIISQYEKEFKEKGVTKKRKNPSQFFASKTEMLEHAYYLTDGIKEFVNTPGKRGKVGRHFGSLQTLLWVSGEYTLRELMNHNRPDK